VKTVVKRRKRKLNSDDDSDYDPSATEATSEHNTGIVTPKKIKLKFKSGLERLRS
jgi:hypothetical protein